MNTVAESFQKNGYVYLSNVLDKDTCKGLTDHMFSLYNLGKLEKDPQCPLSDSIYGDPVFDEILKNLARALSDQLDIRLDPAYTYARIYRPGEVLARHSDRESCEISGTMTLGFDPSTSVWPIYFAQSESDLLGTKLEIEPGDLVMYKGTELPHWRPEFKGIWQVQVFFHYVDRNGPFKDFKDDKRGVQESVESFYSNPIGHMISLNDYICPVAITYGKGLYPELAFSTYECTKIISQGQSLYSEKAGVGTDKGTLDTSVRSVNRFELSIENPEYSWIYDKIASAVGRANSELFKYNLLGITHSIELLQYEAVDNGHYDWHIDIGPGAAATRKISVSIPLSERNEYTGGNLELNNGNVIKCIDEQGSITMFPSYTLHRVSPITSGERWVMVIWIHGSDRFK